VFEPLFVFGKYLLDRNGVRMLLGVIAVRLLDKVTNHLKNVGKVEINVHRFRARLQQMYRAIPICEWEGKL
jgi:hypothetical protein